MTNLTIEQISQYIDPVLCSEIANRNCKDIHKFGLKVDSPLFDFIEFVSNCFYDINKNFASFRNKKPNNFFKKIWLYCYYSKDLPYNQTRYDNLLKFHGLEDKIITRITFDFMREILSKEEAPLNSMTYLAYRDLIKKEGAMFALDSFYDQAEISRDWIYLWKHINCRYRKDMLQIAA